jgi:hypothetical protein
MLSYLILAMVPPDTKVLIVVIVIVYILLFVFLYDNTGSC